jgi:hypothetical protein
MYAYACGSEDQDKKNGEEGVEIICLKSGVWVISLQVQRLVEN